jgi:hypothetical protein
MDNTKKNTAQQNIEHERANFMKILASNPNYFGTNQAAQQKAVKEMSLVSSYEELTGVGYNPETRNLEATLSIKLPYGYLGALGTPGSYEYVRFFLSYDGGPWEDKGLVAVNVHDIPTEKDCEGDASKPLSYTLTMPLVPRTDSCNHAILPRVRAILSWNAIPTAGNPDFPVVWGSRMECAIQIKPRLYKIDSVLDSAYLNEFLHVAQSAPSLSINQINQLIHLPTDTFKVGQTDELISVPFSQLASQYASDKKTTPGRFGYSHLLAALKAPELAIQYQTMWKELNLDWEKYFEGIFNPAADTSYEQLETLGLDYNLERFVATFRIKRPVGYSGDLCNAGSKEFVAFWADWDNTCQWSYVGTVVVNVHDISSIPKDGLCYSAILPVDLTYHRLASPTAKVVRIRAVLSWQAPPSVTDPNELTVWGNRMDTHVQIKPGEELTPGDVKPLMIVLGGIPSDKINSLSGLTNAGANFALTGLSADPLGRACPFGGRVVIQGPSFPGYKYRIQVRPTGSVIWSNVTTPLTLVGWKLTPPYVVYTTNTPDINGFFDFQDPSKNIDNVLGWWDTAGNDLWDIKLEIPMHGEMTKRLQLCHQVPDAAISIDNGGDCKDFYQGDTLHGHFVARASYFGVFSLQADIDPNDITAYDPTVPAPGHGWKLDTSAWKPCGYTVYVSVWDRTILNSGGGSHNSNQAHVGFCLRAKK